MDLSNIKLPLAAVALIIAQAFGIIWYVAQLDSTVGQLEASVEHIEEMQDEIKDLQENRAVMENEMRTIMSDHGGFADVLRDLNASGLLPSGERREYGGYGK
jgi:hypothetical protein